MNVLTLVAIAFGYILIGFFIETLINGDEYTDKVGLVMCFWPVLLVIAMIWAPFEITHKFAMWVRKIFKKE